MPARSILVVEDDPAIRRGIADALRFSGYGVLEAATGTQGLELALQAPCELVLLDLVLPGCDGLEILRQTRLSRPTLPVIILTARGQESDRVKGLTLGADDYVVKPFGIKELLARISAVLRRSPERPAEVIAIAIPGGSADFQRRELRFDDGSHCDLSEREAQLLSYLACNLGRAIAREELISRVWQLDPAGVETRTIDMHIARLREKLRDHGPEPQVIRTVRGKGYAFGSGPPSRPSQGEAT